MNIKDWYKRAKEENVWCVGKGWKDILITLCDKLITIDDTIEVLQVKEKFGGLRFYIGGTESDRHKEIFNLISIAEAESYKVCERCGSKKNIETKGSWLLTLCKECRDENNKRQGYTLGNIK